MPNFLLRKGRLTSTGTINPESRASDAWLRIQMEPKQITVIRGNTTLDEQIVRIDVDSDARFGGGSAGIPSTHDCVVFGVLDHPSESVPDTDLKAQDRFAYDNTQYKVVSISKSPGELQAFCEIAR